MKALVTGIEGFVGRHLTSHLHSCDISVCGCYHSRKPDLLHTRLWKCDILSKRALTTIITRVKPDYVFHLAAISSVRQSWKDPSLTMRVNVEGTKNVLDSVVAAGISPRILIVSSSEVYGEPAKVPVTEDLQPKPRSPYAESKVAVERLCRNYKLDYVITRSFTHIGPGQSPMFFSSEFAKTIVEIERGLRDPVLTYGDLDIVRDITDVRDVVRAYVLCLQHGATREVYNICSGVGRSLREIVDILLSKAKREIELRQDKSKVAAKSIKTIIGSPEKFMKASQWKPEISIEQSVLDALDYWRTRV